MQEVDNNAMSEATAPETPAAATAAAPTPPKVKIRLPFQRACNEKNEKGKLCAGHLKRWYNFGEDIKAQYGASAEVCRCEHCHTVYLPAPGYEDRTGTLQF